MTVAAPLLVVVGPTAVGKTAFAVELAEALNGEIVSADSRYIYRGLEVGTAKPSAAERARVPHHLIDVTPPGQSWSLADYRDAAMGRKSGGAHIFNAVPTSLAPG